jgi:transposase
MKGRNQHRSGKVELATASLGGIDARAVVVGIDLGDRVSDACLYANGVVIGHYRFAMTPEAVRTAFEGRGYGRVAMEAGAQSGWVARLLTELGYAPLVANTRKVKAISANERKSDRNDALMLARIAALDPALLYPVHLRSAAYSDALAALKARDVVVRSRARLVHSVRSLSKGLGFRMRRTTPEAFVKREHEVPEALLPAVSPMFRLLREFNDQVRVFDEMIERMGREHFPATQILRKVHGVGPVTSLAYVLVVEDPNRFPNSRDVAAYLGLVPRRDQSGGSDKQLGISKTGNTFLRRLLVQSAQYILGPFGIDSRLRRWGHKLAERGGSNARKRAVVATARKLAVVLLGLWKRRSDYVPLHGLDASGAAPLDTNPQTAVPGDCAGSLDARRRAPDCSTPDGSDPIVHRGNSAPSESADRSGDFGVVSRGAQPDVATVVQARRTSRPSGSAQAPVTPSAPAAPACAGDPTDACTALGRSAALLTRR